jgi:hypothetical protein
MLGARIRVMVKESHMVEELRGVKGLSAMRTNSDCKVEMKLESVQLDRKDELEKCQSAWDILNTFPSQQKPLELEIRSTRLLVLQDSLIAISLSRFISKF